MINSKLNYIYFQTLEYVVLQNQRKLKLEGTFNPLMFQQVFSPSYLANTPSACPRILWETVENLMKVQKQHPLLFIHPQNKLYQCRWLSCWVKIPCHIQKWAHILNSLPFANDVLLGISMWGFMTAFLRWPQTML